MVSLRRSTSDTEPTDGAGRRGRSTSPVALVVKVLALGTVVGVAIALTPALVGQGSWIFLAVLWVVAAVLVGVYVTGRDMPAKYLVPGTLFLVLFIVYPIVMTAQLSTTNYGDGTRSGKEEVIESLVANSVVPAPGAPRYNLTVGTTDSVTDGPFVFFLVDPASGEVFRGTEDGLQPLDRGEVTVTDGLVTQAEGYTLLTPEQVGEANEALEELTVPTEQGPIRKLGVRQALVGPAVLEYDEASDTITNTQTGVTYEVQQRGDRAYFVGPEGELLSDQSWTSAVGLDNYIRIFTSARLASDFVQIFVWTLVFATLSVVGTFVLGLFLAVTLNDSRMRGQKIYRSLLILPYAIPAFITLLVWQGFYNTDFGLINNFTGLSINWLGDPYWAKVAVLLTNLWLGFPYMFLVSTGALQAIPADLKEAASIDGAGGFTGFRRIIFPLLLVTVAPLLVATFAFNFNNFVAIELLTEGGPFDPANPTAGSTDILITYAMRLAFGTGSAQIGFAAAISVLLFVITAIIAALQFRMTRKLEEVH